MIVINLKISMNLQHTLVNNEDTTYMENEWFRKEQDNCERLCHFITKKIRK